MAILSVREGIDMGNGPVSDTASVQNLVLAIQQYALQVKFMRDPTRGGVAAVLNEIVSGTKVGVTLDSNKIPVSPEANALSEILGIDILNVACEGRMILICDKGVANNILSIWKSLPEGRNASILGYINNEAQRVILKTITGGSRLVDVPTGELLPRIC
jgi:hydrogenase expression/formation protein HypE